MNNNWNREIQNQAPGLLGPESDAAFLHLTAPEIKTRVLIAHGVNRGRDAVQRYIGFPFGRIVLKRWLHNKAGSRTIEEWGLPRHLVNEMLGDGLIVHVDPRKLIRLVTHAPRKEVKRPSSLAFIWDGPWDLRRHDLRMGSRYRLISDLDKNRDHLENTARYKKLMSYLENGKPWASHQQGVLLNTPEKIRAYLRVYLEFLDSMAAEGFDDTRGKDKLGVVISREGRILKINKGLHRLAMAQHLGVPTVPVQVKHVHRAWWDRVTEGATGMEALEKMQQALQCCTPETEPGSLDVERPQLLKQDFWPTP